MANVAQLTTAEYTARFNDQMSAGATAAAEAMEKLAKAADDNDGKARRASSSLAALEARLDSGARLAQAKARADETLVRQQEQLNAAVARGTLTQERANQLAEMATQRRDIYVAGVRRQIAAEEERNRLLLGGADAQARFAAANDNAERSAGRFGHAMGQAGFQVQDFATQVAMGQNALVAFGVQFAQFAGIFGTAGAIAGAVVTVGVLAAQFLTGADSAKALADAIKAQDDIYRAATEAGERYRAGLEEEAQTILRLRDLYASYSAERRAAEQFRLLDLQADLDRQGAALRTRAQSGLSGLIDTAANAARMSTAREARGQSGGGLPDQVREAVAALIEFRGASDVSSETMARLSNQLQAAAAIASDSLAPGLLEAARKIRELLPDAERLERAAQQNARQLTALGEQAGGAGAALGGARASADALASSLDRMRQVAAANPALAVQQEAADLQQRLDALRRGGIDALDEEARRQEDNRRVTEAMNRAYEEQLARLSELYGPARRSEAEAAARAAAAQVGQETMRRNELAATLERERRAREEAARAAQRAAERLPDPARTIYEAAPQGQTVFPADVEAYLRRIRDVEEREADRARDRREREAARERDRMEREAERTTDSIVSYAADRFADLWSRTGRGFAGLMQSMLQMVRQTFARIAAEAIIRPIVQPIVAGIMGAGGAGGGGLIGGAMQMLGLSGLGGELSSALGLSGIGAGISGLLATPLIAGNSVASAASLAATTPAGLLATMPAAPSAFAGATLGGVLGAAGLGFGAGSLVGGLVAGDSPARQTNSMIGAGIGTALGMGLAMVGGPLGLAASALLGGVLGGAGGGLLGPQRSNREGNATLDLATGLISLDGQTGSKFSAQNRQAAQSTAQQIAAALSALTDGLGATLPGVDRLTVGVGDRDGSFLRINGRTVGTFGRDDTAGIINAALGEVLPQLEGGMSDQLRTAIAAANATTGEQITQIAAWIGGVFRPLTEIKEPVDAFAEALKALNQTYDDATKRARELGLSEQALQDGRARAIADLERQRREQAAPAASGVIGGLADFVSGLRFSDVSPLSPRAQFAAANDNFDALLARAQGGDFGALSGLRGAAETLLVQGRNVEGSGAGFAALFDRVTAALGGIGALTPDELTASVYRETQQQATEILSAQLERLTAEVAALRQETRLNGLTPARAA